MTGYSSVSSIVIFFHSKGCVIAPMTSGGFMNGGVLCIGIFGGGSGHAVCGIACHSNGRNAACVGHFTIASIIHSHRCSIARKAPSSHVACFDTGPGKRTRVVGIALGPGPHIQHVVFRHSFDRVDVGKQRTRKIVLAHLPMRGVTLGRGNNSALNKHGM